MPKNMQAHTVERTLIHQDQRELAQVLCQFTSNAYWLEGAGIIAQDILDGGYDVDTKFWKEHGTDLKAIAQSYLDV